MDPWIKASMNVDLTSMKLGLISMLIKEFTAFLQNFTDKLNNNQLPDCSAYCKTKCMLHQQDAGRREVSLHVSGGHWLLLAVSATPEQWLKLSIWVNAMGKSSLYPLIEIRPTCSFIHDASWFQMTVRKLVWTEYHDVPMEGDLAKSLTWTNIWKGSSLISKSEIKLYEKDNKCMGVINKAVRDTETISKDDNQM